MLSRVSTPPCQLLPSITLTRAACRSSSAHVVQLCTTAGHESRSPILSPGSESQVRGGARGHGPPPVGKRHGLHVVDVGDVVHQPVSARSALDREGGGRTRAFPCEARAKQQVFSLRVGLCWWRGGFAVRRACAWCGVVDSLVVGSRATHLSNGWERLRERMASMLHGKA